MKPLNLLIVSIRKEWLTLLEDSLAYAGYEFQIKEVGSKQAAIRAFYEAKYDLLISNCLLPDGKITDLADVLGSHIPCLVMTEGHCPVTAERVLAVTETNYYINCSNKLGWIPALETTLAKWESRAQQKIEQHQQNSNSLYKKILSASRELLAEAGTDSPEPLRAVMELLLEAMELSRVYLCTGHTLPNGNLEISKQAEVTAAGISLKHSFSENPLEIPFFERWAKIFQLGKPVMELTANLPVSEQKWLNRHDIQSLLAYPILLNGRWVAYLALEDTMDEKSWSKTEIQLIGSVAELIQKTYFSSQKSSRLQQASSTSPA